MAFWVPEPVWQDEDVYILGGGPSLRTFDWPRLYGLNVIGCNSAYTLGAEVSNICFFGDTKFFDRNRKGLQEFAEVEDGGWVVTNCPRTFVMDLPWLKRMPRQPRGLSKTSLGWNWNSGASAVNLALILGAKRVLLLGFDMALENGKPNWHDFHSDKPRPQVYDRFQRGFGFVKSDLPKVFPGTEIINVSDCSRLDLFPRAAVADFFPERTWQSQTTPPSNPDCVTMEQTSKLEPVPS